MSEIRQIRVQRSYLVRRIEIYTVEVPADMTDDQVQEWQDADPVAFDEHVSDNDVDHEDYDPVDDDEMETKVVR